MLISCNVPEGSDNIRAGRGPRDHPNPLILQMTKLKLTEAKQLAQTHVTCHEQQGPRLRSLDF